MYPFPRENDLAHSLLLFLIPSKTNGRVPSQQGATTTGCNPTYWEVSNEKYIQTLLASLGVVKGQNCALQWRGGGCSKDYTNGT